MIDPNAVSTIRVGELSPEPFSLTDNVPHEVGTELKRGTIEDLATFISAFIGSTDGVGFRAISVTDGQTLPTTTQQEFILVGKGTYYNVVGGSTIICTEELNAIVSNGSYWFIGVEIPVNVELAGITQFIRDGFINTTPSEDAVYEALTLKANVADSEDIANKQNDLTPDGTGTKYPTVDAVNTIDLQKVLGDIGKEASFTNLAGNQYISFFNDEGDASKSVGISSDSANHGSSFSLGDYGISITNKKSIDYAGLERANISIIDGIFAVSQNNPLGVDTTVKFDTPTVETALNFPAKTASGTYTLATTDEISTLDSNVVHKTGDETITGSKTFQTDTSSPSVTILNGSTNPHPAQKIYNFGPGNGLEIDFTTGTGDAIAVFNNGNKTLSLSREGDISSNSNYIKSSLKLLNSDADLYGNISLNLDRYLFNNKSGNLQFLTQNSGFVTYKSPTISGTFSNGNLTESRTFTLPDATGTIPIISQTITNGVTDKSPSENAVFDALDLKVNLSGNQTITGVTTLVGVAGSATSLDVKNGSANGSMLIGADVNAITRTNGVRKLARFTTPSFSDVTKNHQIFAADFEDAISSRIYFGGTNGSTQLGCTEINFVTVTANGNTGGNTAMQVKSSGAVTINTTTDDGIATNKLQVNGNVKATQFRISALNTAPASATATGTLGEIIITATHIYVCTATNTWVRTALITW